MTDAPKVPEGPGKPPLSIVRWIFAIFGSLIMVFCGGCTLLFLGDLISRGRWADNYVSVDMVLVLGGVPFLIGFAIWWLAAKAGR